MASQRSFDGLAQRFKDNVYGTRKGAIRLHVLWHDLLQSLPALTAGQPLRILDAGGGMGQITQRLAALGHRIVLCDLSGEMLQVARQELTEAGLDHQVRCLHCAIEDLPRHQPGQFDLVLCHAVLEWQRDPWTLLDRLLPYIAPQGHLSLMFYNLNALVLRNLVRGNLYKVKSGNFSGEANSLTPCSPLAPESVYQWLAAHRLRRLTTAGVRVFYDYMPKATSERINQQDLVEMEWSLCHQEPYRSLGRYIHVVCQATEA